MRTRKSLLALTIVGMTVLAACADDPDPGAESPIGEESAAPAEPEVTAQGEFAEPEILASGLSSPWSVTFHGGTALVSERDSGRIAAFDLQGNRLTTLSVSGVVSGGEGGLLGLTASGEHLYVYLTGAEGNRVERYLLNGAGSDLWLSEQEVLLDGIPAAQTHNGGRIGMGPDGMLYVSTGDANDPDLAQDLDSLAGKILRMTSEGEVPEDNPFEDSLVYSFGHRNVQGMTWSRSGTFYATEFGANDWDELNIIEAGGNYGWPFIEGLSEVEDVDGEFIDPVQVWETAEASPSGMTILGRSIYIANLRGERLTEVPLSDPSESIEDFVGEFGRIRDVVVAPNGQLWVITNNTDGRGEPGPEDDRIIQLKVQR